MMATYRLRQGLQALFAFVQPLDDHLAATYLSSAQMTLFQRMNRSERLHSLNVLKDILSENLPTHDLAVAALLHDVGKTRYPLAIWQKTITVLVKAFWPALFIPGSQKKPENMLYRAFVVSEKHPLWGAELVKKAGATERTLWLIEHHADPPHRIDWRTHPYYPLLIQLQAADDKN